MADNMIHNRGRGPEIIGTRITVYNLLPYFLDSEVTEAYIAQVHDLSIEQVAAARSYVLNNADIVLARHMEIEARIAAGNPPEVIERAKRVRERFLQFKEWLAQRKEAETEGPPESTGAPIVNKPNRAGVPDFQEWLATQPSPQHS